MCKPNSDLYGIARPFSGKVGAHSTKITSDRFMAIVARFCGCKPEGCLKTFTLGQLVDDGEL